MSRADWAAAARRSAPLLALLALAGTLRFWGLGFGLPHTEARPDESTVVHHATGFWLGDLNPGFFNYPTLFLYVASLSYGLELALGTLAGRYASTAEFVERLLVDLPWTLLWTRGVSACFGTLTVVPVYALGRELGGRRAGLLAGALMAVAYLHVRESHFATTDAAMTFFIALAAYYALRIARSDRGPAYALAGGAAGLAASTKYAGGLMALTGVLAHLLAVPGSPARRVADRRLALLALAAAVGFLIATPFALLDGSRFVRDLSFEADHLRGGHGPALGSGYVHHLRFSLWHGLGPGLLAAAAAGAVGLAASQPRRALLLFSYPGLYFLLIGSGQTVFVRYALPLVPFLCASAGWALAAGLARADGSPRPGWARGLAGAAALASLAPTALDSLAFDRLLARPDTRVLAAEWVAARPERFPSVYSTGAIWGRLQLPASPAAVRYAHGEPGPRRWALVGAARHRGARWHHWEFDEQRGVFLVNGRPTEERPALIVEQRAALGRYTRVPRAVRELLRRDYRLARRFDSMPVGIPERRFDRQDAFFLPFAGFDGVSRPGPNLRLYERVAPDVDP